MPLMLPGVNALPEVCCKMNEAASNDVMHRLTICEIICDSPPEYNDPITGALRPLPGRFVNSRQNRTMRLTPLRGGLKVRTISQQMDTVLACAYKLVRNRIELSKSSVLTSRTHMIFGCIQRYYRRRRYYRSTMQIFQHQIPTSNGYMSCSRACPHQ